MNLACLFGHSYKEKYYINRYLELFLNTECSICKKNTRQEKIENDYKKIGKIINNETLVEISHRANEHTGLLKRVKEECPNTEFKYV